MNIFLLIRRAFNHLRIKNKLLVSYGLLILVATGTVSFIAYKKTSWMIEQRVVESTKESFEQANTFISYKLNNVKDVSSMLYMNGPLHEILSRRGPDYSLREQIDDYRKLQDIIRAAQNSREIYSIRLFVDSPAIYSREGSTFFSMKDIVTSEWYNEMMRNEDGIYCRSTYAYNYMDSRETKNIISCVRPLQTDGGSGKILGVVSIDILEDSISEIITQTNITRRGQVYLFDMKGKIISSIDKSLIGKNLDSIQTFSGLRNRSDGTMYLSIEGNPSILIHKRIEGTTWQLVALIPLEEITAQSRRLAQDLLCVQLVVFALAVATSVFISEGITRRIRLLLQQIRKIEEEKWDFLLPIDSTDEVGVLQIHFNRMIETMRRLIKEKYQEEVQKKNAELKALQAQINPHFLYNTLDLIHWLALKHRATEISDVVARLAKFFRLSLSKGRDIITLREELEHVRTYLDIQNKRFSGAITHIYEIEPGLEEYETVKLILQPIVENAVLHGIQEREDKRGTIFISGKREGNQVVLVIEDDGVGMTPEQLECILNNHPNGGYGVQNVVEKIKLYYGENYGVTFESEPGTGTRVTIRLPARLQEKKWVESSERVGQEANLDKK